MLYTHFTIWVFVGVKNPKPILLQDAQCSFGTRSRTASWLRPSAEWMAKQPGIPANNEQLPNEPENHFFNKEKHPLQSLAWLNLPSGHPFGWGCKCAPNHGLTVHSTNRLLVIFVLSLQGESLCHSDTNLNRLAPRFGTVLLVHVCFQKYWDTIQQVHMGPYGIWKKWSSPPTSLFDPHRDPKTHHFLLEFVKSVTSLLSTICFPSRFREFQIWNGNLGFHIAI